MDGSFGMGGGEALGYAAGDVEGAFDWEGPEVQTQVLRLAALAQDDSRIFCAPLRMTVGWGYEAANTWRRSGPSTNSMAI